MKFKKIKKTTSYIILSTIIILSLIATVFAAGNTDQYTKSMLPFNGTNGSTNIVDDTGKIWSTTGTAQISTVQKKYGTGSLIITDGLNNYISTPNSPDFNFGTDQFTVDFWVYYTGAPSYVSLLGNGNWYSNYGWSAWIDNNGYPAFLANGAQIVISGTTKVPLNQWAHLAFVREGTGVNQFKIYLDGNIVYTGTLGAITDSPASLRVGRGYESWNAAYPFNGYLDEVNISKGIARTNFPPPDSSLPVAPMNLKATTGDAKVILAWDVVSNAISYNVKRSTTQGGPYTNIATDVTLTTYTDSNNLINGTTYYYIVTAVNANGESTNSNEASATPQQTGGTNALLVITMANGLEKEYDLSMAEIIEFTNWYDKRAEGIGPMRYTINKSYNKGPFLSRKDNLVYDKILSFEIMEYNK